MSVPVLPALAQYYALSLLDVCILHRIAPHRIASHAQVNYASGLTDKHITHDETLFYTQQASENVTKLVRGFVGAAHEW